MKKETLEEYRTNITLHLTRVSGDIEHIRNNIDSINDHLNIINGRLRKAENNITSIYTVGGTLMAGVTAFLAWLGIEK